eukprot:m.127792 g.127792  ORF g.127792 m.127792 type:complete len:153 (+) comp52274_c0_seq3:466-924(+)
MPNKRILSGALVGTPEIEALTVCLWLFVWLSLAVGGNKKKEMCYPARCRTCGKTTYGGCGAHRKGVIEAIACAEVSLALLLHFFCFGSSCLVMSSVLHGLDSAALAIPSSQSSCTPACLRLRIAAPASTRLLRTPSDAIDAGFVVLSVLSNS